MCKKDLWKALKPHGTAAKQTLLGGPDLTAQETSNKKLIFSMLHSKWKSYSQLWEKVGDCGRNSVLLNQLIAQNP